MLTCFSCAAVLTAPAHASHRSVSDVQRNRLDAGEVGSATIIESEPCNGRATLIAIELDKRRRTRHLNGGRLCLRRKELGKAADPDAHDPGEGGKTRLTIIPTDTGKAALAANGWMNVALGDRVLADGGKPAVKTIAVTLRK
jgi:hypothetical protein